MSQTNATVPTQGQKRSRRIAIDVAQVSEANTWESLALGTTTPWPEHHDHANDRQSDSEYRLRRSTKEGLAAKGEQKGRRITDKAPG